MYVLALGEYTDHDLEVTFRARTWELAGVVMAAMRAAPPRGYRVDRVQVTPAKSGAKGGRRCEMRVAYVQNDDRVPRLKPRQMQTLLAPFEAAAQGRAPVPSSPSVDARREPPNSSARP